MTRRILLPVILAAGVGLILLGLGWKQLYPPTSYWSEQQAQQYMDAFTKLHELQDSDEHGASNQDKVALAAAKENYEKLENQLEYARKAHDRTGSYLAAAGAGLVAIGILIYVKGPQPEPEEPRGWPH